MSEIRSARRSALFLTFVAGVFAAVSVLFAGAAAAQTVNCPAGARGGAGGNAGTSNGGTGGLALNVPVFSSGVGGSTAGGGNGGSARGGTGGRGGSGTLPVCNQNTNGGAVAAAPVARGATAAPAARGATYGAGGPVARSSGGRGYGVGGPVGLASTGARTDTELIVAGLAFVVGGALLMLSQPLRRRVRA